MLENIFIKSVIVYGAELKDFSSFKIGGKAKVLIMVDNAYELKKGLKYLKKHKIAYYILGNGSNTLFDDNGFSGVVLCLKNMNRYSVHSNKVYVECGVNYTKLFKICYEHSLGGLEFVSGIPGSVGGLVRMNAGAYGGEISSCIEEVNILRNGKIKKIFCRNLKFTYRDFCSLKKDDVIISCVFDLPSSDKKIIAKKARENNRSRLFSQPIGESSCGSVFKKMGNISPAYLIDKAGLKGYTVGGAKISEKHAGFIVNFNDANCSDVLNIIDYIEKVVYNMYKIKLIREIIYVPQ